MKTKSIEEFANWLGLIPGAKYKIGNDGKPFIISKFYNLYYEGEGVGISLASLSLYQLLDIQQVKE